mmetsp:Transcript_56615/g.127746  ORF Transcript_56615/g.127746 Transcript_56615/m.127746 type:complete len:327 (-) Transcript_56615:87-1067(-)
MRCTLIFLCLGLGSYYIIHPRPGLRRSLGLATFPYLRSSAPRRGLVLAKYPKAGSTLLGEFVARMSCYVARNETRWDYTPFQTTVTQYELGWHDIVNVEVPSATWQLPSLPFADMDWRTLHMVRDPHVMAVSAYRYISQMTDYEKYLIEPWSCVSRGCWCCTSATRTELYSPCATCSPKDLLQSVPEEQGVMIMASLMDQLLVSMVDNVERWTDNPKVLHMSIDQMKLNASQLLRCVQNFLGVQDEPIDEMLDIVNMRFPMIWQSNKSFHVTSGKYNNSRLHSLLEAHPFWGVLAARFRRRMSEVYRRQAELYGCPVPDGALVPAA